MKIILTAQEVKQILENHVNSTLGLSATVFETEEAVLEVNKPSKSSLDLLKEQADTIEHAIAIASELLGIPVGEQRGRCLEYICLEFQSNYNPELTEHIKSLMASEEKLKKAEYKERADKGKKKKNTKKEEVA